MNKVGTSYIMSKLFWLPHSCSDFKNVYSCEPLDV